MISVPGRPLCKPNDLIRGNKEITQYVSNTTGETRDICPYDCLNVAYEITTSSVEIDFEVMSRFLNSEAIKQANGGKETKVT